MEDNINLDLDNEFQEENKTDENYIKKLSPIKKNNNQKYNSKNQKKSKLILNTENDINSNYVYKPPVLESKKKILGLIQNPQKELGYLIK